ncbi:MAG: hypothetical protein JWN43_4587, partial [Gammaproteobacteria bacterium]|nr:hypothetical protein [Gammaproteobacteria bacterium]
MSRAPYPLLLMLAMALPGAARALGLGEIRVDSALNEPLSAQIDIVGATRDELMALTAKVASREVFQRYGAERPSFLASATFKVGLDAQGRPVLNIRSAQAFTDPVVSFLVELRWNRSELVREFSLLLDPSGFSPPSLSPSPSLAPSPSVTPAATLAPPSTSSPATPASNIRTAASAKSTTAHHRVAARDTLRSIARRAGARSEARAQRMMIAIFRANPQAFDGNINRLHRGVLLSIPTMQDLEATDAVASKREFRAQMTAWRLEGRPSSPQRMPVADDALKGRVQYLEHALDDMHRQLAQLAVRPTPAATPAPATPMRVEVMRAPERPAPVPAADTEGPATTVNSKMILGSMAAALALLLAGFALVRRRLVRPADAPAIEPHGEASNAAADSKAAGVQDVHVEAAALPRPVGIAQHDETT